MITPMYKSTLQNLPEPPASAFCEVAFAFGTSTADSHLSIAAAEGVPSRELVARLLPYREKGAEYLQGHSGYFSFHLPRRESHENARLHIAVRYVTVNDLNRWIGTEFRKDFDNLMDIVQVVLREMHDAALFTPQERGVDIVAEPLTTRGALYGKQVNRVANDISCGWLTYQDGDRELKLFSSERRWNPRSREWKK